MRPAAAWAVVALVAAATAAAFLLPAPWVAAEVVIAILLMRSRGRFLAFAAVGIALNVLFFALLMPGDGPQLGPVGLSQEGAWTGFIGALRLTTATAANLAVLARIGAERLLDGLRLPRGPTAFLAAVLASAHDLGREWQALVDARRLEGAWPRGRMARVPAAARLLPALLVQAIRRATVRQEALRLAGHDTAPRFAALVAVTSLAVAARMALIAVPNDPATFTLVFLGGVLFGPATGALAGLLAMGVSNVLISGLNPIAFANAPAMAILGLLGGLVGRLGLGREQAWTVRLASASCGIVGVLLFSVAADVATWLAVPEFRGDVAALRVLVLAGLAFNVLPAAACAVTFAIAVGPVVRAVDAAGLRTPVRDGTLPSG